MAEENAAPEPGAEKTGAATGSTGSLDLVMDVARVIAEDADEQEAMGGEAIPDFADDQVAREGEVVHDLTEEPQES